MVSMAQLSRECAMRTRGIVQTHHNVRTDVNTSSDEEHGAKVLSCRVAEVNRSARAVDRSYGTLLVGPGTRAKAGGGDGADSKKLTYTRECNDNATEARPAFLRTAMKMHLLLHQNWVRAGCA